MAMSEAQRTAHDIAANQAMPWGKIDGSTVVITGATGLIGSQVVRTLIERTNNFHGSIKLILPVRNVIKAEMMFGRSDSIIMSLGKLVIHFLMQSRAIISFTRLVRLRARLSSTVRLRLSPT